MDALSLAAGVIAVLQAAEGAHRAVKFLRTLKEAQTDTDAIMLEIATVKAIGSHMSLALAHYGARAVPVTEYVPLLFLPQGSIVMTS